MSLLGMPGYWQIILVVAVIVILGLLFPILAIADILRKEFTGSNKLMWVLAVLCFPILGACWYFSFGTQQKV